MSESLQPDRKKIFVERVRQDFQGVFFFNRFSSYYRESITVFLNMHREGIRGDLCSAVGQNGLNVYYRTSNVLKTRVNVFTLGLF